MLGDDLSLLEEGRDRLPRGLRTTVRHPLLDLWEVRSPPGAIALFRLLLPDWIKELTPLASPIRDRVRLRLQLLNLLELLLGRFL